MEIINPSRSLINAIIAAGITVEKKYVRTCHSDTCSCFSHESGYDAIIVPDDVTIPPMARIGGSVHCHPCTVLLDARGALLVKADRAGRSAQHASPGSSCSRAGERAYAAANRECRVVSRALEIFDGGGRTAAEAEAQAEAEEIASERAARKAARATFVANGVASGLSAAEADYLYGAGPWCRELEFKTYIELRHLGHTCLSQAANARSHRELQRTGVTNVLTGSHPRVTAWAAYAAKAFYGCVLDVSPSTRDYPTAGTNWKLVTA